MLRHARNKVNARRFDARMPENIRQLDDILVCAIKCRREQVAQIVRENFPCVDARADAQLFHFRPNLISRHGLAAFGAKDRAGGGFCRAANLSSLRQSFDGSRIVRILPLSAISVLALPIFPGRLQPSIVGRSELNFRVRDGNGWTLALISTNCCITTASLQ